VATASHPGAEFRVEDELPSNLAQGVFVPGKRYPACIRFSNGDANVQHPDGEGDVRAMAIKLLDVPGDKILEEQKSAPTQDFILVNSPVFFTDDPSDYLKLVERNASPNPMVKASELLAIGFKGGVAHRESVWDSLLVGRALPARRRALQAGGQILRDALLSRELAAIQGIGVTKCCLDRRPARVFIGSGFSNNAFSRSLVGRQSIRQLPACS
jgi:Catalase